MPMGCCIFTMRQRRDNEDATIHSTKDQGASVNRVEGIPAAGWKGVEFQGEDTSLHHYVDLFSDIENNEDNDYLVMGFWLRERKERRSTESKYGLIIASGGNDPFDRSNVAGLTGTATYEGPATGLYMLKANAAAEPELDYFNAKASLTANFGDASALGSVSGTITESMTDGGVGLPELTLEPADFTQSGTNFHGDTSGTGLAGKWGGRFYSNGASATDHPGSVAGTFGAKTAGDLHGHHRRFRGVQTIVKSEGVAAKATSSYLLQAYAAAETPTPLQLWLEGGVGVSTQRGSGHEHSMPCNIFRSGKRVSL